jgi:hypothetical protein
MPAGVDQIDRLVTVPVPKTGDVKHFVRHRETLVALAGATIH